MNNTRFVFLTLLMTFAVLIDGDAVAFASDEVMPPVAGGSREIGGDAKKVGKIVTSDRLQSGANYALKELRKSGHGVQLISLKSGVGILSASTSNYQTYDNPTATMLSKRAAYLKAYAQAQKELLTHFKGNVSNCMQAFRATDSSIDTGTDEGRANSEVRLQEKCVETVSGLIQRFVIYSVDDDVREKSVQVSILSSGKTRAVLDRRAHGVIRTNDLATAHKAVMDEVRSGVIPPFGARLIEDRKTGERLVVAFGSSIVRKNASPVLAQKLKESAQRAALLRANGGLLAFLKGNSVFWKGAFEEQTLEGTYQFNQKSPGEYQFSLDAMVSVARTIADVAESVEKGQYKAAVESAASGVKSTLDAQTKGEVELLESTRSVFLNSFKQTDDYEIVTKGRLPAGLKSQTFIDASGDWATAIVLYSPTATMVAERAFRDMNSSGVDRQQSSMPPGRGREERNPRGPSGQVSDPDDL